MPRNQMDSEPAAAAPRAARAISLEDFVQVASGAALRAMRAQALTPNPDDPGGGRPPLPGGSPAVVWNPHIIVGLIIRNELGGDTKVLQGFGTGGGPGL